MSSPSFSQVISVKLTQENYLLWSAQILPYLRSQGLIGFVDGSMPPPNQTVAVESSEEPGSRKLIINPSLVAPGPAGTQPHQFFDYRGSSQHGGWNLHCTRSLGYAGAAICLHVSSTSNADSYGTLHNPKEGYANC